MAQHSGRQSPYDFLPLLIQRAMDSHVDGQPVLIQCAMDRHSEAGMAAEVLSVLRAIPDSLWLCKGRANVRPHGISATLQLTLGVLPSANQCAGTPLPTHATFQYPGLCALLLRNVRLTSADASGRPINAIQLTKNVPTKERIDKNNRNKSIAVTCNEQSLPRKILNKQWPCR